MRETRPVELPTLQTERLTLRPLADTDLDPLIEIVSTPGVREWWGDVGDREKLRTDIACDDEDDSGALTIEAGGEIAGWLGVWEESEPGYRHGGLDIMLAPRFQDLGLGPEALRAAAHWLIDERGHHRITIDPAAANGRAIHAYEKVGFRPVGILRRYARDEAGQWQDGLLMDLLADELT